MKEERAWASLRWPGVEVARATLDRDGLQVDSQALQVLSMSPYRVSYRLSCDASWRTRRFSITLTRWDDVASLTVEADGAGHWWSQEDGRLPALDGCLDLDVSITPLTNTLPIRRLDLTPGTTGEIAAAYLKVPELTLTKAVQRYGCLGHDERGERYRYESGSFQVDVRVDTAGFVCDYPGIWRLIPLARSGAPG